MKNAALRLRLVAFDQLRKIASIQPKNGSWMRPPVP
jgi:hypothetical protein